MPRPRNAVPTYRLHKQSGQAIVTLNVNGKRRDVTLGLYNSPESKEEYRRVLANLESLSAAPAPVPAALDLTVNELCLRYWKHAETYYPNDHEGKPASELADIKYAIREFRGFFGDRPAREFGPVALKALRERMVGKGWSRRYVNKQCGRVKRVVRFGVENELLPPTQWEALRSVPGLAAGRTKAPEYERIGPVAEAHYLAVLPHVTSQVRGLLELLALTGMRPGEACRIRPCDIDTSADVWVYRPAHHKTKYRGKERPVLIAKRAQELLARFTPANPGENYFSPARDVASGPKRVRKNPKPRKGPSRARGTAYDHHSLAVAVGRACERAGVPCWHPNQLRHKFGTAVRKEHGLEAAQVLLGHTRADVTQIYAERNMELAVQVASKIG